MKNALAFCLLFGSPVFACEISIPDQLIILGQDTQSTPFISQTCEANVIRDIHEIIVSVEGKITALQIQDMLLGKGHSSVTITPNLIHVKHLASLIREQVTLPNGIQVKSTTAVNGSNILVLVPGDQLEVDCTSCLFGLAQPLKLNLRRFDGTSQTVMARADFKRMVRAYRVTSPVNSFADINPNEVLKEVYIESIPHTEFITNLEQVKFYKTNKPIRAGELLKTSDLNAINLVRAGLRTEVILENSVVRIKTQGISRSNGSLGELVEVYHQQKNKKYLGKVVDHNKVLVEL